MERPIMDSYWNPNRGTWVPVHRRRHRPQWRFRLRYPIAAVLIALAAWAWAMPAMPATLSDDVVAVASTRAACGPRPALWDQPR